MPPWTYPQPNVKIGKHTYHSPYLLLLKWFPDEKIVIGRYCSIADRVVISTGGQRRTDVAALYPLDAARTYRRTKPTVIGNDVWIGYGAMVVVGVTVGDGAIIATGAVVLSDVPPLAVVAGNPARVLHYRFSRSTVERLLRIAWWNWPETKIMANIDWFYRPIIDFVERFDSLPHDEVKDSSNTK